MARPYGKLKKRTRSPAKKSAPPRATGEAFKVKIRGKDNAPLSVDDLTQGLYEAARRLKPHARTCRVKWATLYLTLVDEDGNEVRLNQKGEWVIYPYKSAADEHGA